MVILLPDIWLHWCQIMWSYYCYICGYTDIRYVGILISDIWLHQCQICGHIAVICGHSNVRYMVT